MSRRLFSPLVTLLGALRYELARLLIARSVRVISLLSLLGSALVTLPAARRAVGVAHSQAAEVARLSGAKLMLGRSGVVASFGRGRFMAVRSDGVIGRTIVLPANWSPRGTGIRLATAVGHGGARVLAHVDTGTVHTLPSTVNLAGAHAGGGAGVVAGGVVGAVLPAAVAALGAAWIGASSIAYEYRYRGALLTYVLLPRRGTVLLAKCIAAALFGALLCLATTLVAYGTARLGFAVAGTKIDVPMRPMVPASREIVMAALCGALATAACAVLRMRLLALFASVAACVILAALIPGSTSPLIPYAGRAARLAAVDVPWVSIRDVLAVSALLWWAAALVAVRRRRVG